MEQPLPHIIGIEADQKISQESVYARIEKSGNLPTLPEILLKLIEACDDDSTPLSEIAAIISRDPALSFRVLQLVNSAYYGLRRTFTGVEQGVIYLGANSIKNIAVTTSIHQVFERKRFKAVKQFNFGTFWYHSLMCATLAKRLAKETGFSSLDEAYLSGLLIDIGRLILLSTFPKEHELILLETKHEENELWAETQLIGVNHCEAGSWLINNWKLNSLMADAIRYHHEPLDQVQEAFPLVKIIYISNLLSEGRQDYGRICEAGEMLLGLDRSDLGNLVEGANEEVLRIAENLEIRVNPPVGVEKGLQHIGSAKQDEQDSEGSETADDAHPEDELQYNESEGQAILTEKIKNITLLSGFLENLVQAGDSEAIFEVFEQSMSILYNIEKVLFFLPDNDGVLLKGRTSVSSNLLHLSQGLALPVQKSTSLIVKAYLEGSLKHLTTNEKQENLADQQVLSAFRCDTVLFVPIIADNKSAGIIILGLPETTPKLSRSDCKLIKVIAHQVGLCMFLEDIKTKKSEEIEAERMAAVSMTARKFAHEINNPLGIISNYLTAMSLKLKEQNDIKEELGIIGEEINRISAMVNQMDMFSQAPFATFEITDVNVVIEDVVQLAKSSLFGSFDNALTFKPGSPLPEIKTSKDGLKQILINLLKNASEVIDDNDKVEVRTAMTLKNAHGRGVPEKDGIEIVVEDTGPGLPESVAENLYKPFVTTKKSGHSGLGLSIVQKAVKDLGGSISCVSKPSAGTSFSIYLPLVHNDPRLP